MSIASQRIRTTWNRLCFLFTESMESIQGCPNQQQSVHKKHSFRSAEEKEVRRRRSRTVFTAAQLVELERVFEITHHPSKVIRKILAETINTPETTIQVRLTAQQAKGFQL